jgi:DNA invertase Pin-like site-specific DNA recombinase
MESVPGEAATAVERHPCPGCAAPAGSACRTRAGRTAAKYHTARFILVPSLREELTVAVPAERGPGKPWTAGPPVAAAEPEVTAVPIRIGYARCSSATQELQSQLDALTRAHCTRVFSEKISTRIKVRPELDKALTLAHEIKTAAPDQPVILAVHELKRLARNAAELMTLSAQLQAAGIQLELLSGPLTGIYDPHGMGSMLFAVLAVAAQLDRDYIREKTLEGQLAAPSTANSTTVNRLREQTRTDHLRMVVSYLGWRTADELSVKELDESCWPGRWNTTRPVCCSAWRVSI